MQKATVEDVEKIQLTEG